MDDIEQSNCCIYNNRIHYNINGNIICLYNSLPDNMVLNYRLLIEMFGFYSEVNGVICGNNILYCNINNNCKLSFYMESLHYYRIYTLYCNHNSDYFYTSVIESKNFDGIIKFLETNYPQIKITPPQKLVIND